MFVILLVEIVKMLKMLRDFPFEFASNGGVKCLPDLHYNLFYYNIKNTEICTSMKTNTLINILTHHKLAR